MVIMVEMLDHGLHLTTQEVVVEELEQQEQTLLEMELHLEVLEESIQLLEQQYIMQAAAAVELSML